MEHKYLTSKDILDKTGISRATLNNYIARGFLPRPVVSRPEVSMHANDGSGPRQIGHFPPDVLNRVEQIQQWKRGGVSMDEIGRRLGTSPLATPQPAELMSSGKDQGDSEHSHIQLDTKETLTLTVEQLPHMAYMVNYKFELLWLNDKARSKLPDLFRQLPPGTEDRSIFKLLLGRNEDPSPNDIAMLRANLTLAKERMELEGVLMSLKGMQSARLRMVEQLYHDVEPVRESMVVELPIQLHGEGGAVVDHSCYATYFREGILIVIAPRTGDTNELLRLLSRRDVVIRSLLSKRLPVLTDLAVLVADLQESVKICSELPPDEYFELINKIWATAGEIFRKYYGTYGKHVGDGMVYYFFPQPDSNYVMNAAVCAQELKAAVARISKEWQLRKNWLNELYLNTGLNEGQEWLGTFQTSTNVEFVVLGETINHTARLSDMARYGQIWATKNFMSKLPPEHRDRLQFGIERTGANGQRVMVPSSYSRVGHLVDVESGRYIKLQDIAGLAVTEIRGIAGPDR